MSKRSTQRKVAKFTKRDASGRFVKVTGTKALSEPKSRKGAIVVRSSKDGRFLSVASLKPVSKRASITRTQADQAVRRYLELQAK